MSYIEKVSVGGTQYDFLDKNIASIETTSIASKAYAAGEYLVVGGQLCKATTAIAQNDSLVLNTNIESTLVGNELQSLSNEIVPVSDAWDVGVSYAVDDICIYNNTLYKCILAHTSSLSILPTDTTYWTATSVGGELSSLNSNYNDLKDATYSGLSSFKNHLSKWYGPRAIGFQAYEQKSYLRVSETPLPDTAKRVFFEFYRSATTVGGYNELFRGLTGPRCTDFGKCVEYLPYIDNNGYVYLAYAKSLIDVAISADAYIYIYT